MSWEGESFRHKLARVLGFAGNKDSQANSSLNSLPRQQQQLKMPLISGIDEKVDYLLACGYTKPEVKIALGGQYKSSEINKSYNKLVSKEAAKYGHGEFMGEQF